MTTVTTGIVFVFAFDFITAMTLDSIVSNRCAVASNLFMLMFKFMSSGQSSLAHVSRVSSCNASGCNAAISACRAQIFFRQCARVFATTTTTTTSTTIATVTAAATTAAAAAPAPPPSATSATNYEYVLLLLLLLLPPPPPHTTTTAAATAPSSLQLLLLLP